MELFEDKYRPVWSNPCTSEDMPGCMVLSDGKYRPKLEGGFVLCTDDKTGCMELSGGKYRPILTYDEYDNIEELQAACCCASDYCWDLEDIPEFASLTFNGIVLCPDSNANDNNGQYALPRDLTHCDDYVAWHRTDPVNIAGNLSVSIFFFYDEVDDKYYMTILLSEWVFATTPPFIWYLVLQFFYRQEINCADIEGPFDNQLTIDDCTPGERASHRGYDGTCTVSWSS